jgi:D-threo-aldose 1-dehydrogenase
MEETTMHLEKRRIGHTKLEVTALGLGTATLGGNIAHVTDAEGRQLVTDAYKNGILYFDTAPFYGLGKSEHAVGDALRDLPDDWILSTKIGRVLRAKRGPIEASGQWLRPFPNTFEYDYSYDAVMRGYEDSLQRLGLGRIDIVYVHDVDVISHGSVAAQQRVFEQAMSESYRALDELRRNGDIGAIGLGVNEAAPISEAMTRGQWDVFLLAGRYTLLEQGPVHDLLPAAEKHGASIVIGGPFNSGILAGGSTFDYSKAPPAVVERVARITRVCAAHKVPVPAAALQFPLAHPVVASVIPGPRNSGELSQIMEWWQMKIPAALWSDLRSEGVLDKDAPVPK